MKKCDSLEEFVESLESLLEKKCQFNVIIEEFYEGHELDIEILIQKNQVKFIAISDNFPALAPYFFELGK